MNRELVNKYQRALELANFNKELEEFILPIRNILYQIVQEGYEATIEEIVWVECFLHSEGQSAKIFTEEAYMMELKEFSKDDWYVYPNATHFNDGSLPLISTRAIEEFSVDILLDKSGIDMQVFKFFTGAKYHWNLVLDDNKVFKKLIYEYIRNIVESTDDLTLLLEKLKRLEVYLELTNES